MKRKEIALPVHSSNEPPKENIKKERRKLSHYEKLAVILISWTIAVISVATTIGLLIPNKDIRSFEGQDLLFKMYLSFELIVENGATPINLVATSTVPFQMIGNEIPIINAVEPSDLIGNISEYVEKIEISDNTTLSFQYETEEGEDYVLVRLSSNELIDVTLIDDNTFANWLLTFLLSFMLWIIVGMFIILGRLR